MYTNGMLAIAYDRAADLRHEAARPRSARAIALAARQQELRARRGLRAPSAAAETRSAQGRADTVTTTATAVGSGSAAKLTPCPGC